MQRCVKSRVGGKLSWNDSRHVPGRKYIHMEFLFLSLEVDEGHYKKAKVKVQFFA